jgi:hypothetical protein
MLCTGHSKASDFSTENPATGIPFDLTGSSRPFQRHPSCPPNKESPSPRGPMEARFRSGTGKTSGAVGVAAKGKNNFWQLGKGGKGGALFVHQNPAARLWEVEGGMERGGGIHLDDRVLVNDREQTA